MDLRWQPHTDAKDKGTSSDARPTGNMFWADDQSGKILIFNLRSMAKSPSLPEFTPRATLIPIRLTKPVTH